jgi:hypothetical protein
VATRHWKVRPYVLTGGRTRTRQHLLVHTLISVPHYDSIFAATLLPEARSLYENARETTSLAELSAHCGISLGVTRVVIDDLATIDRVLIHPESYTSPFDRHLLERLRDGLRQLA